mgnify:CR=1 FL=1
MLPHTSALAGASEDQRQSSSSFIIRHRPHLIIIIIIIVIIVIIFIIIIFSATPAPGLHGNWRPHFPAGAAIPGEMLVHARSGRLSGWLKDSKT